MGAIDTSQWQWQATLTKTQQYLRNRITGNGCERDQIEAWRQFYRTHDPVVRLLVAKNGIGANSAECVEEVWLDLIANLNTLRAPQSYDSFLFWLKGLVRRTTQQFRMSMPRLLASSSSRQSLIEGDVGDSEKPQMDEAGQNDLDGADDDTLDDRLLHLRLVEAQPIERVARTLGLTCQQVLERQRGILKRILSILIRLDIAPANL
jgi:hypothetical protein